MSPKSIGLVILSVILILLGCVWSRAAEIEGVSSAVQLTWDKNTEPDIKQYVLQWFGGSVTNSVATTNNLVTVPVVPGTWVFRVKAVNTSNLESPWSQSITASIPVAPMNFKIVVVVQTLIPTN